MELRKEIEVVAAVVIHEGEVLCMQRGATKYPYTAYHWEFSGGKIEAGESAEEALQRELLEEMDYPVQVHEKIGEVYHRYPDFDIHLQAYRCTASSRQFLRKEHVAHCWLLPSALQELQWCEADYPLLEAIQHLDK